jgi:hypothetical protein
VADLETLFGSLARAHAKQKFDVFDTFFADSDAPRNDPDENPAETLLIRVH